MRLLLLDGHRHCFVIAFLDVHRDGLDLRLSASRISPRIRLFLVPIRLLNLIAIHIHSHFKRIIILKEILIGGRLLVSPVVHGEVHCSKVSDRSSSALCRHGTGTGDSSLESLVLCHTLLIFSKLKSLVLKLLPFCRPQLPIQRMKK